MNGTVHHNMAGVWSPTNESLHVSILYVMNLLILIVSGRRKNTENVRLLCIWLCCGVEEGGGGVGDVF